jgi:hypothetical protein
MSSETPGHTLRHPATDFSQVKIPRTRQPARKWFRIHQHAHNAIHFSLNNTHRFSHEDCPYAVLYLAIDVDTCLFERFGDIAYDGARTVPQSLWEAHCISSIHVPELRLCDLTGSKTLSALQVDYMSLMHHELSTPQEWGLAIQMHPAEFQAIKFKSRFNGKACLAVFQRDNIGIRLRDKFLGSLLENEAAVDWLDKHKVSLY